MMQTIRRLGMLALCAASPFAAAADATPPCDRLLGQQVFVLCMACHTTSAAEPMRTGPSLAGVYGKPAAAAAAFRYSPALLAAKLTWNDETLERFLANPAKAVPGTLMAFPGLKAAADRAAAICMLRELAPARGPVAGP